MRIKYVFWGYSDYMKVVNNDILYNKDVLYFAPNDLSVRQKILYNILFFMTRYGWENMVPEFIYRYLYPLQTIHGYEQVYFIKYTCSYPCMVCKGYKYLYINSGTIFSHPYLVIKNRILYNIFCLTDKSLGAKYKTSLLYRISLFTTFM